MEIVAGGRKFTVKSLVGAALKNSFPDLLFIAAGKVDKPGASAKFRIALSDGGHVINKWNKKVEYTDVGGTAFGNMFEGFFLDKDNIQGNFEIKFEINTGSGWQEIVPTSGSEAQVEVLVEQVITFDTGAGVVGALGLILMP